jgi:hypothetical protein
VPQQAINLDSTTTAPTLDLGRFVVCVARMCITRPTSFRIEQAIDKAPSIAA